MNPQLTSNLRHLRLSGMAEALPLRLEQARSGPLDAAEFLELLVGDELARRSDRLFARRLKQAGFEQLEPTLGADHPETTEARRLSRDPAVAAIDLTDPSGRHGGAGQAAQKTTERYWQVVVSRGPVGSPFTA